MLTFLVMAIVGALIVPGEPICCVLLGVAATNAPLTPFTLRVEMETLFLKAALSKVASGLVGEAPKLTLACKVPLALNRLTASAVLLKPTPPPL